ncbi:MAG: helix-hairpin-helix domain-containing protein, partial [Thermofilaceae archaeon]
PAKRVVITDYRRYNVELGYHERISVMEYKQMAGRAGRPKYDLEGEAVLIARTAREVEFLMKEYVAASPERIFSQLGSEQVLRSQVLSLVATEDSIKDEKSLKSMFSRTLFSAQFSPLAAEAAVEKVTRWLLSTGFLERTGARIRATAVGKRVAELYIDPMTARMGLEFFKSKKRYSTLSYLFLLASTPDMTAISIRKEDIDKLEELLQSRGEELPSPPEDEVEYEWYLSRLKTALLLEDWINEVREDVIVERYDVGPGDIYSLTQTAEWIAYSLSQVAEVAGFPEHSANLSILSKRIKHGVREELLELVSLRGIGRVRARSLFNHGFKSLYDLVTASERDLARVPGIGPSLARAIKAQLQGGAEAGEEREVLEEASGQSQLDKYLYPH